jgi:myosin V
VMQPHVYEVSALAYKGLAMGEGVDQSILVSGESGAGKTETVKICLNHIASVQRGQVPPGYFEDAEHDPVVKRVVQSNPLLEAFGNAQTRRNDNSSRFGKYLQLQFKRGLQSEAVVLKSAHCGLVGSKCDVYLLEKNRVIGHDSEERTFHIFYQLLAASEDQKAQFWEGLRGAKNESFKYVGPTKTNTIEGMHDADRFQETLEALALVDVEGQSLKTLMQAMCIVLQLGNLGFKALCGDIDKSEVATKDELKALSGLMGVSEPELALSFTKRTFKTEKETYKVNLSPEAAKEACDALAKEAYQKVFLWLVNVINKATCADESSSQTFSTIGLLDIFGFEVFPQNRFEQLCINYANEKLQQKFNEDIFKNVQAEYKAEGIHLSHIWYDDNTDVLDLIEGRTGLLNLLNEECIRPKGNDMDFVHKALRINQASSALTVHRTDRLSFGIQHYAGQVMYDAENFVSKNLDTLPTDLQECAEQCTNTIINTARSEPDAGVKRNIGSRWGAQPSNITAPTVWTKYKSQLSALMTTLRKTQSRYVRCIKPNSKKEPHVMEHDITVEQLRCAGVVAGITIARSAFPNRLPNSIVLARYSNMWDARNYPSKKRSNMDLTEKRHWDCKALLEGALKSHEIVGENGKTIKAFAVGKTKTFFRSGALEFLEAGRMTGLDSHATVIQRAARGWLSRNAGKYNAQLRRMEEAQREAARRAEAERLAKLAKERAERRAACKQGLQSMADQLNMIEKSCAAFAREQDRKVQEARARNERSRQEIQMMKLRFAQEEDEGVRQRQSELAEQRKMLEENDKLIAYLKKENRRARKEQLKVQMKLETETEKNKKLSGAFDSVSETLEYEKELAARVATARSTMKVSIEEAKVENKYFNGLVSKQQEMYMTQAKARLQLQKSLAKILTLVQEKIRDRSLVEETVVTALKAEALSKSVMAALDVESLEPDLTSSDISESGSGSDFLDWY